MERYLVHAYEGCFGGMHGIEDWFISEGTRQDAFQDGCDASHDLMENHGVISDFYDDARSEIDDEDGIEEYVAEAVDENVCVDLYLIRDDTGHTTRELEFLLDDFGGEEFIEKYCEEI